MTASLALALLLVLTPGQAAPPSGDTVLARAARSLEGVQDYTATLDVVVSMERMSVPPMRATVYFKRPNKLHVAADGFALIPREGLGAGVADWPQRYTGGEVTMDTVGERPVYRVAVTARSDRTQFRRGFLFVHRERWTTERIVLQSSEGRSMTATLTYDRVEGHWLPRLITVAFAAVAADTTEPLPGQAPLPVPRRTPRTGTVDIRCSDYRVNTGLPDELFEERPESDSARPPGR